MHASACEDSRGPAVHADVKAVMLAAAAAVLGGIAKCTRYTPRCLPSCVLSIRTGFVSLWSLCTGTDNCLTMVSG